MLKDILEQEAVARAAKAYETQLARSKVAENDAHRQANMSAVVQRIHAGFAPHVDALTVLMLVGGKFGTYALGAVNSDGMTSECGLRVHVAATARPDGTQQVQQSVQLEVEVGDKPGTLTVRLAAVHYQPFYRDETLQHFDQDTPIEAMLKAFFARIATHVVV